MIWSTHQMVDNKLVDNQMVDTFFTKWSTPNIFWLPTGLHLHAWLFGLWSIKICRYFQCTSIFHTIKFQTMLFLCTYHKARNNDSKGVKKADKHRDFGDFKLLTIWWTINSMCQPIGETRSVDHFVVDQMAKILIFVDDFECQPNVLIPK